MNVRSPFWTAVILLGAIAGAVCSADAGSLNVAWVSPTTNADGSPLTDLAGYRLYLGTAGSECPGNSFHPLASTTPAPTSPATVEYRVSALGSGTTYYAAVTAVDSTGNESACTGPVSAVANPDLNVVEPSADFGNAVPTGTAVDRQFTVQNMTPNTLAVAASAGGPFSVVSGSSVTLPPGGSAPVTVRFASPTPGSFVGNVVFTASGDTVSRSLTATAVAPSVTLVTLSVATSGKGGGVVTGASGGIVCGSDCTETVAAGATVTLTATPEPGSAFSGWSGACSGTASCVVTLNSSTTVTAKFALTSRSRRQRRS